MTTELLSGSLVGRTAEVDAVEQFLGRIPDGARAVVLEGAAGIGKTRVWSEGVQLACDRDCLVLRTRPAGAGAEFAFAGLGDLLRDLVEGVLPELPAPQRRALGVALFLEDAGGDAVDRHAVGAALLGTLRQLVRDQSVVLAVDDVQWLDSASRDVLAFALRRLAEEPIGLLATLRLSPDSHAEEVLGALPEERISRIGVGPLSVAALYEIVRERYELSLSRPLLLRLYELSEGNPLYALELTRGFAETGELAVPRDLSELLRVRLDALSVNTRNVLLAASALSRPTREKLEEVSRNADDALAEASTAGIVEVGAETVRFTHPLLAAESYATASPAKRRSVHRRLAEIVDDLEERARHLALAASGPDEEVALTLDEATAAARERGALAAAVVLADLALGLTPAASPQAHARAIAAAGLLYASGDATQANQLLVEELERTEDSRQQVEILLKQGELAYQRDFSGSRDLFLSALERAGEDDRLRAHALSWLASGCFFDDERALAYGDAAVEAAERSGDSVLLAFALSALAEARYFVTGEIRTDLHERAIAVVELVADEVAATTAAMAYASILLDVWDLDRAHEVLAPLIERARASGDSDLPNRLDMLAHVELLAGNLERAAELDREAIEIAAQCGRVLTEVWALFHLGWVESLRGDLDLARKLCARSLRLAEQSTGFVRGARLTLGYLESALGDYDSAWVYLDPANPLTGTMPPGRPVLHVPEAVEVLAALGRTAEAAAMLEPFENRVVALSRGWARAAATHCRGLILAAECDLDGARDAALESVVQWEASGQPLWLGRALLQLGTVQRRLRRKAEARATLERAIAIFEEVGAAIWLERARRELKRIGGRGAPAGEELSATEAEIARLAAAGHSNKEVAEALHLSPKTVEWNLSKIYRKLGVRSRTELAATP